RRLIAEAHIRLADVVQVPVDVVPRRNRGLVDIEVLSDGVEWTRALRPAGALPTRAERGAQVVRTARHSRRTGLPALGLVPVASTFLRSARVQTQHTPGDYSRGCISPLMADRACTSSCAKLLGYMKLLPEYTPGAGFVDHAFGSFQ